MRFTKRDLQAAVSAGQSSAPEASVQPDIAEARTAPDVTTPGEPGIETPSTPPASVSPSETDSSVH